MQGLGEIKSLLQPGISHWIKRLKDMGLDIRKLQG